MRRALRAICGKTPELARRPELELIVDDAAGATDDSPAFRSLVQQLDLSPIEAHAVALAAAVEHEPAIAQLVGALQGSSSGTRPTLGLVAAMYGSLGPVIDTLLGGAAHEVGLLTLLDPQLPLVERRLAVPFHVVMALRGHDIAPAGIASGVPPRLSVALPRSVALEAGRQARALVGNERALVIRSGSRAEAKAIAQKLAEAGGRRAAFIEGDVASGITPWLLARRLVPVFCKELGPGERWGIPPLPRWSGPVLVITGHEGTVAWDGTLVPSWSIPIPSPGERIDLWRLALGDTELASSLGRHHRHGAGRIAQLGRGIRHQLRLDGDEQVTHRHVLSAAWTSEGAGLGGLAEPVRDQVPDGALVVGEILRRELDLLLLRCRSRDGVSADLGVTARARHRPGVRALFVGPSGTGKTLAAGWLATSLGVPLYRVDLSAVTSKYIGETEKNLAQLLSQAEHEEIVLLFDEADAMFGKRTEVKEANDRFANAQTNFLLQRIESFDGIAILTSNSRSRFDTAFTRRLDAILEFPLPGPDERRELWLSHLGAAHALAPGDINRLAAVADLCGGHVRNVVVTAAVQARSAGRRIELADILVGLTSEYRKLGRSLPSGLRAHEAKHR